MTTPTFINWGPIFQGLAYSNMTIAEYFASNAVAFQAQGIDRAGDDRNGPEEQRPGRGPQPRRR